MSLPVESQDLLQRAEQLWADTSSTSNASSAVSLFQQAFNLGDRKLAAYRLGNAFFYGKGVERDLDRAFSYLACKELDGDRFPLYFRGLVLKDPSFSGHDNGKALSVLRQALALGVNQASSAVEELQSLLKCSICHNTPTDRAENKNICEHCHSNVAERAFANAYDASIHYSHDVSGRLGLLIEPSAAERELFVRRGASVLAAPVTVFDGEFSASVSGDAPTFDFIYTSQDIGRLGNIHQVSDLVKRVLKLGGVLFAVDTVALPNDAAAASVVRALTETVNVQKYVSRDNFSDVFVISIAGTFVTSAIEKEKLEADAIFVASMVAENKINEIYADAARSVEYLKKRKIDPYLTYTEYATNLHKEHVREARQHATLGANIPDRSRKQGHDNFVFYRDILQVKAADRVIEYGCGSLRVGIGFVRMLGAGQFFGLDVVPDFYEIGVETIGSDELVAKQVRFDTISRSGVRSATEFGADHVFASAVVFHIHPDDIVLGAGNLVSLASKPGCKLLFDCKVTRDDSPRRFAQTPSAGGWAWPVEFYRRILAPLQLTGVHKRVAYSEDPSVDFAHLEFRNPYPARLVVE